MGQQWVTNMISQRVHQSEPNAKVMLFGSRARGDARPDSDWDVMVLLNDGAKTDRYSMADIMIRLGWEIDEMINPIVYSQSEWGMKTFTPFYKNVMQEGIIL